MASSDRFNPQHHLLYRLPKYVWAYKLNLKVKKILINIIQLIEIAIFLCLFYSIWYLADKLPNLLLGLYILVGIPLIATGIYAITNFLQHLVTKGRE